MSMTENEALEILNNESEDISKVQVALYVARKALEEIQQYRAIGTVEECRATVEKQIPKKPVYQGEHEKCPTCGSFRIFCSYCSECGQKIDWQ